MILKNETMRAISANPVLNRRFASELNVFYAVVAVTFESLNQKERLNVQNTLLNFNNDYFKKAVQREFSIEKSETVTVEELGRVLHRTVHVLAN